MVNATIKEFKNNARVEEFLKNSSHVVIKLGTGIGQVMEVKTA